MVTLTEEVKPAVSERAGLESKPRSKEPVTPKERRGEAIRKDLDKPKAGWERLTQNTSVNNEQAGLSLREKIGTKNEKGERIVDTRRQETVERFNKLYQGLLERGFDGLSPTEQMGAREQMRTVMLSTNEGQAMLAELGEGELSKHIDGHLRNPDLVVKLKEQYGDLVDSEVTNGVPESRRKLEQTQATATRAAVELKRNAAEQRLVRDELAEYEDRTLTVNADGTHGQKGGKLAELEELEKQYPHLKEELGEKEVELERVSNKLSRLEDQLFRGYRYTEGGAETDLNTLIEQTENKTLQLAKEIKAAGQKIDRRDELITKRANLIKRSGELEIEQVDLEDQNRRGQEDFSLAQVEFNDAKDARDIQERAFVSNFGLLLQNTTREFFAARMKKANDLQEGIDEEELGELTDNADKALNIGLRKNYGRGRPEEVRARTKIGKLLEKKGLKLGRYNETTINDHFKTLLQEGDAQSLLKSVLATGAVDPITGETLLTDEDIAEKLKDPDFVARATTEAVQRLIKAKMAVGEITKDEAAIIAESNWGANAILAEAEKKPEIKAEINELKAQIGAKDTKELLSKLGSKGILSILLMLFGSIASQSFKSIATENR